MAEPRTGPTDDGIAELFDSLLYAVSHDLKSPLLSVSLGAELVTDLVNSSDDRSRLAFEAMRHGAKDLERLLDAVTLISRARRRPLDDAPAALPQLLGGHLVVSDGDGLDGMEIAVDPRVVTELLAAVGGGDPVEVQLAAEDQRVCLAMPLPEECPEVEVSPLHSLVSSLTTYAGTPVATLAGLQAQLERQGGAVRASHGRLIVQLPRVRAAA